MQRIVVVAMLALISLVGCGEDKDYGDPLTEPGAPLMATASVSNAAQLTTDTTNDTALNALNALSGNYNQLTGYKYQAQQAQAPGPRPLAVDEACVVQTDTSITYSDCDYAGNVVNGSVTRAGTEVTIDVHFFREDVDSGDTTDIDAGGTIDISAAAMVGNVSFDVNNHSDDFSFSSEFDGYYDVVVAEGCATGGQLEVRAHASVVGQSQTVWAMAEFGPACGDVVVR